MFALKKINDATSFAQKQKSNVRTFGKKNAIHTVVRNGINQIYDINKKQTDEKSDTSDLEK